MEMRVAGFAIGIGGEQGAGGPQKAGGNKPPAAEKTGGCKKGNQAPEAEKAGGCRKGKEGGKTGFEKLGKLLATVIKAVMDAAGGGQEGGGGCCKTGQGGAPGLAAKSLGRGSLLG